MRNDPVLVCYDDSPAARQALREASSAFPGSRFVIVTVWKRFTTPRLSELIALQPHDVLRIAASLEAEAQTVAHRGVAIAESLGVDASPLVLEGDASTWHQIVKHVRDNDYRAVVLGGRGQSALVGVMLGGVATMVAAHANRPVMIVHESPEVLDLRLDDEDVATQLPALGAL